LFAQKVYTKNCSLLLPAAEHTIMLYRGKYIKSPFEPFEQL